jgi:hypothetical protein
MLYPPGIETFFIGHQYGATGFVSRVLTELGYSCGHEYLKYDHNKDALVPRLRERPVRGDSNWLLLDYLNELGAGKVVYIKRDPLSVISSIKSVGGAKDIASAWGRLKDASCQIRARADFEFKVETEMPLLCRYLGIEHRQEEEEALLGYNSHNRNKINSSLNELKTPELIETFRDFREGLGYGEQI